MSSLNVERNAVPLKSEKTFITKQELVEMVNKMPKCIIAGHELEIDLNEPDEESFIVRKAKEELRETSENIAQGLKELRELCADDSDWCIPDDDNYLQIFLRPCKWYAPSAFLLMKRYYRFFKIYSCIFTDLILSDEKLRIAMEIFYLSPVRNKDGCKILIIEAGRKWKPKEITVEELFKCAVIALHSLILEPKTQIAGTHIILDVDGFNLSQISYFTPSLVKMIMDFTQKCLLVRLKSINIVNQPYIFNMLFAIFKPLMEAKIRKRLHFHGTDWESLTSIVDKSALFTKYGGGLELFGESFSAKLAQRYCIFTEYFKAIQKYGYKAENKK